MNVNTSHKSHRSRRWPTLISSVLALSAVVFSSLSGSPAVAKTTNPAEPDGLGDYTLSQVFPGIEDKAQVSGLAPEDILGHEILDGLPQGTTTEEVLTEYPLSSIFDSSDIVDLEERFLTETSNGDSYGGPYQPKATAACYGPPNLFFGCGIRFTNTESRVIANAALGGSAAGYQVACGFIPNPIIAASCRVGAGAFFAGTIAYANIVLADPQKCLFYSATNPAYKWGVVSC